jgi:hypothetical protein
MSDTPVNDNEINTLDISLNDNDNNDIDDNHSNEIINNSMNDETINKMKQNYSYPDNDDPNIQYKLYKKREFYYNKIPQRPQITEKTNYNLIKNYRDNTCARPFSLHDHQGMLSNFINPDTPYKGILVFHGLGSGKCVHKDSIIEYQNNQMTIEEIYNKYKTIEIVDNNDIWSIPSEEIYLESYDIKRQCNIKKKVLHLFKERVQTNLKKIELENGRIIIITKIHKLFTKNNNWTNNLKIGDSILTQHDDYKKIVSIENHYYDDFVYDLEIEETHNYYVNNILCHNTCVGVAIAEKFKEQVLKYNTKIHILVPGPIIKESWKSHLIKCTGNTYKKEEDKYSYIDNLERERNRKNSLYQALQYYKLMSYRTFQKKVIGERISDLSQNNKDGTKTKNVYRKNKDGKFERDLAIDRIHNLNNSVLIIDEAHNITGNTYGDAVMEIIKKSFNLKVVLMTATPMKNLGDDIIKLINFIRPVSSPILREKVFTSHSNYLMDFKENGLKYFKNMINGYVSHVRGSDPLTFAKRIDKGTIPDGLQITPLIKCDMLEFQRKTYDKTIRETDDALDRASEAVANMTFPGLSKDRKSIIGYFGGSGINMVKEQLKVASGLLNKKVNEMFFKEKTYDDDLVRLSNDGKTITGRIFTMPYLKYFSIKFYKAVKKLSRLVAGKRGAQTAFVYSNLVVVGIDIFKEILLMNGYLEYNEDSSNYQIEDNTVCYYCGQKYKDHKRMNRLYNERDTQTGGNWEMRTCDCDRMTGGNDNDSDDNNDNDSDDDNDENEIRDDDKMIYNIKLDNKISDTTTEYSDKYKDNMGEIKPHKFYPATFMTITGGTSDDTDTMISDSKKKILDNVFNDIDNKEGKNLKFILGSRVMNEGISMRNVGEVHILDVYYNLGKVDQVVGRAIRWCSHYSVMDNTNIFPYVNVYKYVVGLGNDNKLSSEEDLYRKAEQKYLLIKKIERAMKERAFDCPLNMHGNIFSEEVSKYSKCSIHHRGENNDKKKNPCPAICDYQKCTFKCDDPRLNYEFYDPEREMYKMIDNKNLDKSTFTEKLAQSEIKYAKRIIKEMYVTKSVYKLDEIVKYVKNSYSEEKKQLFDEFFVFKALDKLIPITPNDFNNFKDTVINKENMKGYLIYRDINYIFQPFNENEDVPMYYRTNDIQEINNDLSLYNYLRNNKEYKKIKEEIKDAQKKIQERNAKYNFDDTMEYYDKRTEYDYVGIIDKNVTQSKIEGIEEIEDEFKLREKIIKNLDKQRQTGLATDKGAVCVTAKSKGYLKKLAKKLDIDTNNIKKRTHYCAAIQHDFYLKEKYSVGKDKLTYLKIPFNHPKYEFPLNLQDRVDDRINRLNKKIPITLKIKTHKIKKKTGPEKGRPSYKIIIKETAKLGEYKKIIMDMNGEYNKKDKEYVILLE